MLSNHIIEVDISWFLRFNEKVKPYSESAFPLTFFKNITGESNYRKKWRNETTYCHLTQQLNPFPDTLIQRKAVSKARKTGKVN